MKFNISYPLTGAQKTIDIDDDKQYVQFLEKKMGNEVAGDSLGDEYKGYVFKITGGNDKDGFPMRQGVMVKGRVRLLFDKNQKCYRPRRTGERRRKSIRGCIVGNDIAVLALSISKKGDNEIPGLTDSDIPRHLGPKRANKIRKLFALKKDETALIKKCVVRRKWTASNGKLRQKAPKIQRLITDARLSRKLKLKNLKKDNYKKSQKALEQYKKLVHAKFQTDSKNRKASSRKESERKASHAK